MSKINFRTAAFMATRQKTASPSTPTTHGTTGTSQTPRLVETAREFQKRIKQEAEAAARAQERARKRRASMARALRKNTGAVAWAKDDVAELAVVMRDFHGAQREQSQEDEATGAALVDEELTAERIADAKEAFAMFDKDGDGAISAGELITVMRSLGMNPTENEIVTIMAELDIDGNGSIELHEFVHVMLGKMQEMETEDEIKKVFRVFDRDGNGFINAGELRYMMQHVQGATMSEADVDELMRGADMDGDGQLNYEEFVRMLVQE